MKSLLAILSLVVLSFMAGCSSNSTGTGGDPFNPGGGGTGNITFTTSLVQDQQGGVYFRFTPSAAVTLDSLTANCQALGVNNVVVQGDHQTVFNTQNPMDLGPITGLAAGQAWSFVITGRQGTPQGSGYSSNVNYTIQ